MTDERGHKIVKTEATPDDVTFTLRNRVKVSISSNPEGLYLSFSNIDVETPVSVPYHGANCLGIKYKPSPT